jgi:hypothetical protein
VDGVRRTGKSLELRDLLARYPDQFVFELRRGGFIAEDITQRPAETLAYISVAATLPESPLHAAIHGWKYPLSREGMLLLDLMDLTGRIHAGKKWKPLKRPWKTPGGERFGQTDLPPQEAIEKLRRNAGR